MRRRDCMGSWRRRDFSPRTGSWPHRDSSPRTGCTGCTGFSRHRGCRDFLPRTGFWPRRDWRLPPEGAARRRPSNSSPHARRRERRDLRRTGCTDFSPHRDCRDSLRHAGSARRTGWPPRKDSLQHMDCSRHMGFSPHTDSSPRTDFSRRMGSSQRRGWRRSVAPGSHRDLRRRVLTARPRPEVLRV